MIAVRVKVLDVRRFRGVVQGLTFGCVLASVWVFPARAQVFQSDAAQTPLPQPVSEFEANLVTQSSRTRCCTVRWA